MDIQILLFLQNLREALGSTLNTFFAFITTIAVDHYVIVPALILFWAVDKKKGAFVLTTCGSGFLCNAFLKSTFCTYRPWIRDPAVKPLQEVMSGATGYSFPSGHASSVGSFYSSLIAMYRKYRGFCVFCVVMVLLTMFSRIYVGVHTPQDVLAGAATGVVVTLLLCGISKLLEKKPNADIFVLLAATVVCAVVLVYVRYKPYPMDYVNGELLVDPKKMTVNGFKDPGVFFGVLLGWFLERRFVKFEVNGTAAQKVLRCTVGGLLYIFFSTAIADPIGKAADQSLVYFVTKAAPPLLFMTVYPLIFTKLEHRRKEVRT